LTPNKEHFDKLKQSLGEPYAWAGVAPSKWAESLPVGTQPNLSTIQLSRDSLISLSKVKSGRSDEEIFLSVMAWGGMRRDHGRTAWALRRNWLPIVELLRVGNLTRKQAYKEFSQTKTKGLGPAYFTKLIFFCSPNHDGYIMDQWTSKSINLLYGGDGQTVVHLSGGWVTPKNTPEIYENFSCLIEALAEKLALPPAATESLLFSNGGKLPGRWRKYVKENY
jgi:hypothetical protein